MRWRLGLFCAVITSLQQQHELAVIKLFATFAKDAPDEQVDLFTQQFDLDLLSFVLRTQSRDFLGESGFQWCHHADMMQSKRCTNLVLS